MGSMRDTKRIMERKIKKGSTPLQFERIELDADCYQEIASKEKLTEVLQYLHRVGGYKALAGTQSSMMEVIEPMLTQEEHSVYKRGRNAHSPTMAKHATMADYRRATGFEALMGYLYLKDDFSRIIELVRAGIGEDKI